MGLLAEQIAQIKKFSFAKDSTMVVITAVSCVRWLAYLVYLRRFFPFSIGEQAAAPS